MSITIRGQSIQTNIYEREYVFIAVVHEDKATNIRIHDSMGNLKPPLESKARSDSSGNYGMSKTCVS